MTCPKCLKYHFHVHRTEQGRTGILGGVKGSDVIVTYRCLDCEWYWKETVFVKETTHDLSHL